uniref:NADH dehydrogenase subunit 6 n=1 Tax=Poecilobdella javanica TaxID=1348077 RepID=UPI001F12A39C|nr:NADH dehydrogenase subunit 6 [Poecilobdella javanica]ULO25926.1 NADH dehydrogenase subunit 6 [Poecilobdella javanica]
MSLYIMFFIMTLVVLMMYLNSPIMLLINVLGLSLLMAWMISLLFSNWFSFMIFLIYIGGMLVMFSYFVALSPNQMVKLSSLYLLMVMIMLIVQLLFLPMYVPMKMSYFSFSSSMFSSSNIFMVLMLILILLMIMLVIVKLVDMSKGPLRPFK